MRGWIETAGVRVAVECELGWASRLIGRACAGALGGPAARADVRVSVEASRMPFETAGAAPVTRGAWRRAGDVVVENVVSSGFDLRLRAGDPPLLAFRWRPPLRDRAAAAALPARFRLLVGAALLHYPALWAAGLRGLAPLHAAACLAGAAAPLLAGPGGVGKSTLLAAELRDGGAFTSDNLCVSDGRTAWGLVEPMRLEAPGGRRTTHGRVEVTGTGRVASLRPDRVVVVRRGLEASSRLRPCAPEVAARSLVTGTYMAGELRRYWGLAATLAEATGLGPPQPPVAAVAEAMTARVPCLELTLPSRPGARLARLLEPMEATA